MSLTRLVDPDADWEWFDNVRKVTYYPFNPATENFGAPIPDVDAFYTGLDKREVPVDDGGEVHRESVVYHLRASQLGIEPTKRGMITDNEDGTSWIVQSVQMQSYRTRARCETVRA